MPDFKNMIGGILVFTMLFVAANRGFARQSTSDAERKQLQSYLTKKGLHRLSVRSLEIQLANELEPGQRRQLAAKLSDDYQTYFLSQHQGADQQFVQRAEQLMRDYPATSSPELRLAIQHSAYLVAEHKFQEWWQSGSDPSQRMGLSDLLFEIQRELQQLQQQNKIEIEQIRASSSFAEAELAARLERSTKIERRMLHGQYLQGWVDYFLGVIAVDADQEKLSNAELHFRSFLQIDAKQSIQDFDESWFDFSTVWNIRAIVGLASVFRAQNKPDSVRHCFKILKAATPSTGAPIDGRLWRYRGMVYAKQWAEAEAFIDENAETLGDDRAFWLLVLGSSKSIARDSREMAESVARRAMINLAHNFDVASVAEFVAESKLRFKNDLFTDLWLQGYLELFDAESKEKADDATSLKNARTKLQAAVAKSITAKPTNALHCKFLLASIDFREKRFHEAVDVFEEVAASPRNLNPNLAVEARWMKLQSLIELSRSDNRYVAPSFEEIEKLSADPKAAKYKLRVEFEELRLSAKLMPAAEAIQEFAKISSQHPLYTSARFEMLFNQYRVWQANQKSKSASEEDDFDRLVKMQKEFCSLVPPPSAARQVQAMFLVMEARLGTDSQTDDLNELDRAIKELAAKVDRTSDQRFRSKLNFYSYMTARKLGNVERTNTFARLLASDENVVYKKAGLVHLAKQLDFLFDASSDEPASDITKDQLSQAADIYRQLSSLLGNSEAAIANSKNSRLAASRLVDLQIQRGQFRDAALVARRLVNVFPDNKAFVAQYARALSRHGKLVAALPSWRKLSRAAGPGQELWFEAKYWIVKCLKDEDPKSAKSILKQTISLSGELNEPWKSRFAELQQTLPDTDENQ